MTTDLKTAGPDDATTVLDEIFQQNRFHHVPIVNDEKRVVGIISKSDFLYLLRGYTVHETDRFRESAKLRGFKVKEIMHEQVVTIQDDAPIREAVAQLYGPGANFAPDHGPYQSAFDCSKIKRFFGWTPQYSWRDQ